MRGRVLIYGATGYTGRLIAERLRNSRRHLVVAGRTPDRVQALAAELGVAGEVMAIDDAEALDSALEDVDVLINAASPFALTAPALIESCLRTNTHYLDIAGELPVFLNAFLHDEAARGRGIMIMPGAGFGVVASDSWRCTWQRWSPTRNICASRCGPVRSRGGVFDRRLRLPIRRSASEETEN